MDGDGLVLHSKEFSSNIFFYVSGRNVADGMSIGIRSRDPWALNLSRLPRLNRRVKYCMYSATYMGKTVETGRTFARYRLSKVAYGALRATW